MVTKRLGPLQIDGKKVYQIGIPIHWGFVGINTGPALAGQRADAVRGRRQLPDAGVQGVPRQHREDVIADDGRRPTSVGAHRRAGRGAARRATRSRPRCWASTWPCSTSGTTRWDVAPATDRPDRRPASTVDGRTGRCRGVVKATEAAGPGGAGRRGRADGRRPAALAGGSRPGSRGERPGAGRALPGPRGLLAPLLALGPTPARPARTTRRRAAAGAARAAAAARSSAFRSDAGDALVSGGRRLSCARCGARWNFSAAPARPAARRPVEAHRLRRAARRSRAWLAGRAAERRRPHASRTCASTRAATCQRYLIDVDLGRDPRAVPEVDELAALPLDLYASDRASPRSRRT